MASLSFTNAYQVNTASTPAAKEQNSLDFLFTSLGAISINDGAGAYQFSGNDVSVTSIIVGGTTYYGWISRPIKSGGDIKGFYFWTDPQFTSLAAATADGNTDADGNDADNLGFILVVDQAWFDGLAWENQGLNLKNVKSSSDKVDTALNALLPPEPPGTPTVTITEDTNNDGFIAGSELAGNVDVSIALPGDAVAGDTLIVSDGTTTQNIVLTSGQISAGTVATSFAPPVQGATITVTAQLKDQNDVTGASGSDSAVRDTAGPAAPTVTITEDANNDGTISAAELAGNVDVSIALPGDAVAGDVLTVGDGSTTQTITLTAQQISDGSIATSFAAPAPGAGITVTAYLTDALGNQGGNGQDAAVREQAEPPAPPPPPPPAPAPLATGVTLTEDANDDGVISGAELDGDVDVRVALPANAVAGDTLTVQGGGTTHTIVLTQQQVEAGEVMDAFAPPAQGDSIVVTAWVTNQQGASGPEGSDQALRDTVGPAAPGVMIVEDADNNAVITPTELSGEVDVLVTLPSDAAAGDTLSVSDGTTLRSFVLTGEQIAAREVATSFTPPAEGATLTVTAWVTDAYGNAGTPAGDSATRLAAPPPVPPAPEPTPERVPFFPIVVITEDIDNNGVIGGNELLGDVDVLVALPFNAAMGDLLTVTAGAASWSYTLGSADLVRGMLTLSYAPPASGSTFTVEAHVTSRDGVRGASGSDSAVLDTSGPATPRVVITEDANDDGVLSPAELSGNVDVAITLGAGVMAGDLLQVFDGSTLQAFTLTAQQVAAGTLSTSFAPPAGGSMMVLAAVTDSHGNRGGIGYDTVGRHDVPVYSVLLASGDRFYSTDAQEAAVVAQGTGNVFEGARFDSLAAAAGGVQMHAFLRPATGDWYFAADGAVPASYGYEALPGLAGFMAAAAGTAVGDNYHLYVNGAGITQLVTQAEANQLGLQAGGYQDWGALFTTTAATAFSFDAEGYLVANKGDAAVQALVHALAGQFRSTSEAGFVDAVEQDYLARVQLTGISHGGAATAAEVNAAFGTAFGA